MNKDIDQVFWPTWLAVSQLRGGLEVDDGAAFYRRACQWVDSARNALRDLGYSEHSVEHMLYTQCALLDESVLNRNRQDSGYITWLATPLAEQETLSLKVTGTNGQLPRRALQSSLLNRCEQILQTQIAVRNLCKPTLPAYPPAEDRFHWRVLSHLGSSFLNMMASAEVLKGTLSLYNWQDDELNYRRLDAIMDVQQHEIQRFEKGFLLRGVDIEITLDENGFTGEGDIHLFGEMLNRFFALYADIHLFNQLTLIIQPAGKSLRWKENHNQRLPGC
ncbi:hypothetical protein ABIE10_003223 [Citrobacter sp. 506]|uniref:type VI secretion system baseplate subunit TssF n=1 Tax=Citrobacter sp. 506 TaxID=3156447 RepID=UPI003D1CAD27